MPYVINNDKYVIDMEHEEHFHSLVIPSAECEVSVCNELRISPFSFHKQNLQIRGVNVAKAINVKQLESNIVFNELYLKIAPWSDEVWQSVAPAKLPMMPLGWTPYSFADNKLKYFGQSILADCNIVQIPLPETNTPRYLKGYSFPFLGTDRPFHELRINPKNTGHCPGQCKFCHRYFSQRMRPTGMRILPPEFIVNAIVERYGLETIEKVDRVLILTELFGSESKYLDYLEKIKLLLIQRGFSSAQEFTVSGQDVRTTTGLERLWKIVNPKRFAYTLEVFSNRSKIMSRYKGIPLNDVLELLGKTKQVGFDEIQMNYVAGIDQIRDFEIGLVKIRDQGLVDSIGFNVFTPFFSDQISLRATDAWSVRYYYQMAEIIRRLGIQFYEPHSYEMGTPFWIGNK